LRQFGFNVTNDIFADNSWYFRNALVRANYTDAEKSVYATEEPLDKFFDNLLFHAKNKLSNRSLHINARLTAANSVLSDTVNEYSKTTTKYIRSDTPNGLADSEKLSKDERIKMAIKGNPKITTQGLADGLGIGLRTVKRHIKALKENGEVLRVGSDKTGYWEVVK
jgi:predicted HTH transcriptional regulator